MHAGPAAEEVVLKKPAGKGGISKKPASNIQKPVETVESSDDEEDDQKRDRLKARKFDKLLKMDRLPDYIKDEWKHVPHEALCTTCIIVRLAHAIMHTGCQISMYQLCSIALHHVLLSRMLNQVCNCFAPAHIYRSQQPYTLHESCFRISHTMRCHQLTHCMSHIFASATQVT